MDGGDDTAPSYDDVGGGDDDDDLAVEEDDGGATTTQPPPVMSSTVEVFLATMIRRARRLRPRVTRPKRRRAVVPGAVGSGHGARRSKEFQHWRDWYLRKKRRERVEAALWYHMGIPPTA